MPNRLIILFLLVPMAAGVGCILLHRSRVAQRALGLLALCTSVGLSVWALATVYHGPGAAAGVLVSQMGNWPAPYGITIAVDALSAVMLLTSSAVALGVFGYCLTQLPPRFEGGYFHPLFHLLLFGVSWSFVTGDLFNLFVAFEIMLMGSYALFTVGTTRAQMRQAYKYVLLNLITSTIFVTALGLLYGQLGTLNMAHLAWMAMAGRVPAAAVPTVVLLLFVFATKAAAFPVWYWLPETYPALPPALGGLFAGLLTKVGVYATIRVFVMVFGPSALVSGVVRPVLLISAGATMLLGALGAVGRTRVREVLSILIISGVGFMMLGIGLGTPAAVAGSIYYAVQHMAGMAGLFLCCGLIERLGGTDDLRRLGGLATRSAWLGALFFVAAMSLVGLPPLSGFFGKWVLISESLHYAPHPLWGYLLAGSAVATGAVTLLAMLRVWGEGFWSTPVDQPPASGGNPKIAGGMAAAGMLVAVSVGLGLFAGPALSAMNAAAVGVVHPRPYVAAVLGERMADALPPDNVTSDDRPAVALKLGGPR